MKLDCLGWLMAASLASGLGCAHKVKVDETSVEGHKAEARSEYAKAGEHVARYDPTAVGVVPGSALDQPEGPIRARVATYNPTEWHLREAARFAKHAREHEHAAEMLEAFEEGACADFTPKDRAACPFFGPIRAVELLDNGVRLRLEPGTPVGRMVDHVNCHLAYARARGFEVPSCPLMLRGVQAAEGDDHVSIVLRSSDPKVVRELQKRAREIEPGTVY